MDVEQLNSDTVKDVVIPLLAAAFGAVAGAAASYLPARLLAKRASAEVLERDRATRRDQEIRAAQQVWVKLNILVNSLGTFHNDLEKMIARAERERHGHWPLYEKLGVFPAIDREPAIEFTAEELAVYVAAKRPDYVDDLILLARRYNAILGNLVTFAKLKAELHDIRSRLGTTIRSETGVSSTHMKLSPELANFVRVRGDELELFARPMIQHIREGCQFGHDIAERFADVTAEYLGKGVVFGFRANESTSLDDPE